jgi:hypothetical protein
MLRFEMDDEHGGRMEGECVGEGKGGEEDRRRREKGERSKERRIEMCKKRG